MQVCTGEATAGEGSAGEGTGPQSKGNVKLDVFKVLLCFRDQ